MTDSATLLAPAECVEAATGADREMDAEIAIALFDGGAEHLDDPRDVTRARRVLISHGARPGNFEVVGFSGVSLRTSPAYTASLDAAKTLVPEGCRWGLQCHEDGRAGAWVQWPADDLPVWGKLLATPALALTAASLRARAAMEGEG